MNNPTNFTDPSGYTKTNPEPDYTGANWYNTYIEASIKGFTGGPSAFSAAYYDNSETAKSWAYANSQGYGGSYDTFKNDYNPSTGTVTVNHIVKTWGKNGGYENHILNGYPVTYMIYEAGAQTERVRNESYELRVGDGNPLSFMASFTGLINSQREFEWKLLSNAQKNKVAYNIQKGLKANGEKALTTEIKAGLKNGFKSTNVKLGVIGGALIVTNVVINQEVMPSDVLNTIMTGVGMTGWGAPIAAGYFIADMFFNISGAMDKNGPIYVLTLQKRK